MDKADLRGGKLPDEMSKGRFRIAVGAVIGRTYRRDANADTGRLPFTHDSLDDLKRETNTVLNATAIVARSFVDAAAQKRAASIERSMRRFSWDGLTKDGAQKAGGRKILRIHRDCLRNTLISRRP
jgi:hypothetical protein